MFEDENVRIHLYLLTYYMISLTCINQTSKRILTLYSVELVLFSVESARFPSKQALLVVVFVCARGTAVLRLITPERGCLIAAFKT